jgi:hypothetical protein
MTACEALKKHELLKANSQVYLNLVIIAALTEGAFGGCYTACRACAGTFGFGRVSKLLLWLANRMVNRTL